MRSDNPFLTRLKLEIGYFTGRAWQNRQVGGAGVILRLARILPRRSDAFQPLQSEEVTPRFLDRMLRALKRWKYDFVTMDEVCRRAVIMSQRRRFVALTFDGAYNDFITAAYPVLARHHDVPFYVVVPTSTIDPATPSGAAIPIEQRAAAEVTGFGEVRTAPIEPDARNDAFDVTPAELVTATVTEHGVLRAPYDLRGERPDD